MLKYSTGLTVATIFVAMFLIGTVSLADASPYAREGNPMNRDNITNWEEDKEYVDSIRPFVAGDHPKMEPRSSEFPAFYIELPDKIQCNNWIPVFGQVPEFGILTWTVISGEYLSFANLSNPAFGLINYFYLECSSLLQDEGQLNVTFIYNDPKDKEIAPNTKVKDLGIDRNFLYITKTFQISGM